MQELASHRDASAYALTSELTGCLDDLVESGLAVGLELDGFADARLRLYIDEPPPGRPLKQEAGTIRLWNHVQLVPVNEGQLEDPGAAIDITPGIYDIRQFSLPEFDSRIRLVEEFGESAVRTEERLSMGLGCGVALLLFIVPPLLAAALGYYGGEGIRIVAGAVLGVYIGTSALLYLAWHFGFRALSERREALNRSEGAFALQLTPAAEQAPLRGFYLRP